MRWIASAVAVASTIAVSASSFITIENMKAHSVNEAARATIAMENNKRRIRGASPITLKKVRSPLRCNTTHR